jgi:hypothetical protein
MACKSLGKDMSAISSFCLISLFSGRLGIGDWYGTGHDHGVLDRGRHFLLRRVRYLLGGILKVLCLTILIITRNGERNGRGLSIPSRGFRQSWFQLFILAQLLSTPVETQRPCRYVVRRTQYQTSDKMRGRPDSYMCDFDVLASATMVLGGMQTAPAAQMLPRLATPCRHGRSGLAELD